MDATKRRQVWSRSLVIVLTIGVSVSLWSMAASSADEASDRASRSRTRSSVTSAEQSSQSDQSKEKDRDAQIERKLDEILSNQQTILQRFDAVMEELRIIKIRATLRGGS